MQPNPRNSAAPTTLKSNRGEHLDTAIVPAIDSQRTDSGRETQAARRARLRADERRSKESRQLNELIEEPRENRPPATFEMTPEERRAYGAELLANGWQSWEIRARLAAPEGVRND